MVVVDSDLDIAKDDKKGNDHSPPFTVIGSYEYMP